MTYLFVATVICFFAGLALFMTKRFQLMRLIGSMGVAAGCFLGLAVSVLYLYSGKTFIIPYQLPVGLPFTFGVDPLSSFFLVPLFLVGAMASIYSYHYLDDRQKNVRISVHYFFLALLIVSMAGVVLARSMISFAFFWEAMSVTSAALVLFDYEKDDNRRAAFRYFVYTQAGGLAILAAFGLLFAFSSSFEFVVPAGVSADVRLAVFLVAMIGFGSKAGLVPLHVWLPHAHPAAPSHVSALMSGVMIKLGVYGLLRMYILLAPDPLTVGRCFLIAGAISAIIGVIYAIGQHNLKRLLAYHSVENMGIIMLGCGAGIMGVANSNIAVAAFGFAGGFLHIWNHALFKSVLFMGAGCVQHSTGTLAIDHLGGLMRKMPKTGTLFLTGAVAICGLPPLNGFVSEFLIYASGFKGIGSGLPGLLFFVLLILSLALIGGLAIACFTKVFGVIFLGEPRAYDFEQVHEASWSMLLPMFVLVSFCVAIGLFSVVFVRPALTVAEMFYGRSLSASLSPLDFCGNLSMAALGFILLFSVICGLRFWFYRGKVVRFQPTWGCGFSRPSARMQYTSGSFARSIIELFRPLAPLMEDQDNLALNFPGRASYHSKTLDIFERFGDRWIAYPLSWWTAGLRRIQHGNIQLYMAYIVLAVLVLLLLQIWL